MSYNNGDEKKYFPSIIAALIVLASAIGVFVYSLFNTTPGDLEPVSVEITENGESIIQPVDMGVPITSPHVPEPVNPPPNS